MNVTPAYGRTLMTQKSVKESWNKGEDFMILSLFHGSGRYINKEDKPSSWKLQVRYGKSGERVMVL